MKLLLIGYRATGKSSAGRMLAQRLGLKFVDTDDLIEERAGKCVSDLVQEAGWPAFRAMEKEILREVTQSGDSAIVACGGGVVLHEDVLADLPTDVHVAWLTASVDTIVKRMEGDSRSDALRPSLTSASSLRQEVKDVLAEREPLYRKFSQFTVDTEGLKSAETVDALAGIWEQMNSARES